MVETPILYTPSPSPPKQSNLPVFYCALIIVGMAVILFGLYNLLVTRLCNGNHTDHRSLEQNSSQGSHNLNVNLVSSFRFNKEELGGNYEQNNDYECAVCLSVFEEGEEIKQLPICKHSFHASCVDMWLYSHLDCPMCRSPVEPPVVHRSSLTRQEESSPEELLVEGSSA